MFPVFTSKLDLTSRSCYNCPMIELKTAEHVIHFMNSSNLSLSRYDEKFIISMQNLTQVTTNQVELFYKLIYKYRRQLAKHKLEADDLIQLPWVMPVVESSPTYTDGHVTIDNGLITFRCPYNRAFIDLFRKQPMNFYRWVKEKRHYEVEYGTHSLRILLEAASKIYKKVHCCDITTKLIDDLKQYEAIRYWNPTMIRVNGNLIIAAINEQIYEVTKDMVLDTEPNTLAKLAFHGVAIDPRLHDGSERMNFISAMHSTIETENLEQLVPWLKEIGCDYVYLSGLFAATADRQKFITALHVAGIQSVACANQFSKMPPTSNHKFPVLVRFKKGLDVAFDPYRVAKIVQVVNSQPINIK